MWGLLLAFGATALFLLIEPPLYRSEATVFVRTPGDVSQVLDGGDSYAQGRARTYAALARSTDLAARVVEDAGLDLTPEVLSERIDASPRQGTALIDIAVSAPSAAESQRTATVFLSEYAATVRTLESVPGSLVPRAELVVVDPPGPPERRRRLGRARLARLPRRDTGRACSWVPRPRWSVRSSTVRYAIPATPPRFAGRQLLGSIGDESSGQRTVG